MAKKPLAKVIFKRGKHFHSAVGNKMTLYIIPFVQKLQSCHQETVRIVIVTEYFSLQDEAFAGLAATLNLSESIRHCRHQECSTPAMSPETYGFDILLQN